jgi:hypothetical protein
MWFFREFWFNFKTKAGWGDKFAVCIYVLLIAFLIGRTIWQ